VSSSWITSFTHPMSLHVHVFYIYCSRGENVSCWVLSILHFMVHCLNWFMQNSSQLIFLNSHLSKFPTSCSPIESHCNVFSVYPSFTCVSIIAILLMDMCVSECINVLWWIPYVSNFFHSILMFLNVLIFPCAHQVCLLLLHILHRIQTPSRKH
jgi:hypothetical protein